MNQRIVYTRPDGGVTVRSIAPALVVEFLRYGRRTGTVLWIGEPRSSPGDVMSLAEAEAAALAYVLGSPKDVPPTATNVFVCKTADLYPPTKTVDEVRRFRKCWRQAGAALPHVDLPLARLQRMAEIRVERDARLVASDGPMLRVQETGTLPEIAAMKAYRQALRDVPQTTDLSGLATSEALAAFEPVWPLAP